MACLFLVVYFWKFLGVKFFLNQDFSKFKFGKTSCKVNCFFKCILQCKRVALYNDHCAKLHKQVNDAYKISKVCIVKLIETFLNLTVNNYDVLELSLYKYKYK